MGQRPRVILDVDGVLCDFLGPCLRIINKLMGTKRTLDEMKTWHIFDALNVPKDIEKVVWREMKSKGWCKNLPVYNYAIDGVKQLREVADVVICTSPMDGETWVSERAAWLSMHFGITKPIIHTDSKWAVAGDILIDDKTETLLAWQECHPDGQAIRWSQATNIHVPFSGTTLTTWAQVVAVVTEFSKQIQEHRRWTHK